MKGWIGVAGVVASYDTWAAVTGNATLSAQFKRATAVHPMLLTTLTAYLVLHLWGLWPRELDPFCTYCRLLEATRG